MFFILLLCFCVDYVCGSVAAEEEKVICDGVEYLKMQDEESLLYGFGHTRIKGSTAKDILPDIKAARGDVTCTKVYQGHEVGRLLGKTSPTVHFSIKHENRLSVNAANAFLEEYALQGSVFCGALEDLADFGVFLSANCNTAHSVCIGLPPKVRPGQRFQNLSYGYDAFLTWYKNRNEGTPIVFFSSGRIGLRGAGEFLFQLQQALGTTCERVNFFFTALEEQEYFDVHLGLAMAANAAAHLEDCVPDKKYWMRFVKKCVERVGCQMVHKGHVVFAQSPGNILVAPWPLDVSKRLEEQKGPLDVFVGWPSYIIHQNMAPYLAQAHMLFANLSLTLGAGCLTGQEEIGDVPDKAQHTLVCVDGPSFVFAQQFGEWMKDKFKYKKVEFLNNDLKYVRQSHGRSLLVGGRVVQEDEEESFYFDLLLMQDHFKNRPLKGREGGIAIEGRVYARMRDLQSSKHGFVYALQRGETARSILLDVKREQEDLTCDKVYQGSYEKTSLSQICAIKHVSLGYEKKLSERAVSLLLNIYGLQNCFLCVSFEDFVVFGAVGELLEGGSVHVSDPKQRSLLCEPRFDACLREYTPGRPIVFCASGRDEFASAGEFLCALSCNEAIKEQKPRVYFLVTTVLREALRYKDGSDLILHAARCFGRTDDDLFDACTQCVAVADIYDGKVVFARDRTNLLVGLKPDYEEHRGNKLYDVLVNWLPNHGKDAVSVAYRQSAQCLFEGMRDYGASCVTGEESANPAKRERTLLCVKSERFDGAEAFGYATAEALGYKSVDFISCDSERLCNSFRLVADGVVETPVMPDVLREIFGKNISNRALYFPEILTITVHCIFQKY